jgi:hypothetical protein
MVESDQRGVTAGDNEGGIHIDWEYFNFWPNQNNHIKVRSFPQIITKSIENIFLQ